MQLESRDGMGRHKAKNKAARHMSRVSRVSALGRTGLSHALFAI